VKKTETRKFTECDMCKKEIIEFAMYHEFMIGGLPRDICNSCYDMLAPSLEFLIIVAGGDIEYTVVEQRA
jgi:hypothetical protein